MSVKDVRKIENNQNLQLKLTGDKEEYDCHKNVPRRPFSAEQYRNNRSLYDKTKSVPQLDLHNESHSNSLDSIDDISKDLPSSAIFSQLITEPLTHSDKSKSSKLAKTIRKSDNLSVYSEESVPLSEVSSTDALDAKIKKIIEESKKCEIVHKEVEDMINNSKVNEDQNDYPRNFNGSIKNNNVNDNDKKDNKIDENEFCQSMSNEVVETVVNNSEPHHCELVLTPGLKSKPPLPKKNVLPKITIESVDSNHCSKSLSLERLTEFFDGVNQNYNQNYGDNNHEPSSVELEKVSEDNSVSTINEESYTFLTHHMKNTPIELKYQNWIDNESENIITNDIVINETKTDISLQEIKNQQNSALKIEEGKEEETDERKRKDEKICLKKILNGDKDITDNLDRMFACGDGINNSGDEKEFLEWFIQNQGQEFKKRKSMIPKTIINNKIKVKKQGVSKCLNRKQKNFIKADKTDPKSDVKSKSPEVETFISYENRKMSTDLKQTNFSDFLENINEIEMTTVPLKNNKDINFLQNLESKQADEKDDPYDDIVTVLNVLENVDKKSHENMESMKNIVKEAVQSPRQNSPRGGEDRGEDRKTSKICQEKNSKDIDITSYKNNQDISTNLRSGDRTNININSIMTYLDEIDKNYNKSLSSAKERVEATAKMLENNLQLENIPQIEDLCHLSCTELSSQIVDMHLRLKNKSQSIALLQKELSNLREQITRITRQTDEIVKQKLRTQKDEYEEVVKRHQKFIDQLIADKKTLNQQCEGLIHETKVLEERFSANMRAAEHRHKVEIQKIKDMHKADEKIRREKWVDNKTQKIKELTVKSLEPELDKMAARHQRELSDLRALHKNEIEDLELRHSRKMQQQMEALREQLTEAREKAISHERELMRQRYEKLVETEEKNFQEQRRKLMADHANRLVECEDRENAAYAEKDRAIRQAQMDFEEQLQNIERRNNNEMNVLKEKMKVDIDIFRNNYKKQQESLLAEKEMAIREKYRKERDKEIEAVIDRLEQEANESQNQIEQAANNRIRRLREKFENEIKELENSEKEAKAKYMETKSKLLHTEDVVVNLKASVKQLEVKLQETKELNNKLLNERDKIKEVIREEMKVETKNLEKELESLKNDKDRELHQVYSRVRMAVARKDDILQELSRDHIALQEKCTYLENMLEQQRKEYLIK